MTEKMDSDRSFSGESSSSSSESSSSGSTDGDDEALETVRILGHTFQLPQDLCEDYSLFKEVFSMKTWESLEEKEQEHLKTFLPTFKDNDNEEKDTTLKMLFDYEPFKFTSPLSDFYNDLKLGNYRPDLAKMRKALAKARRKQQKQRMREYYAKQLPSMLLSRERLLATVKGAPPGPIPYLPRLPPKPTLRGGHRTLYQRAKQRYFDELNAVRSEVGGDSSDDEMYPEGPDEPFKDRKPSSPCNNDTDDETPIFGTLSGSSQSYPEPVLDAKEMLIAHKLRRMQREIHPELNTNGITLEDVEQRVSIGGRKIMFGGLKSESPIPKKRPKKDSISRGKVSEGKTMKKIKEEVDEKTSITKIKYENESDSESSSFVDPVASPKASTSLEQVEIKQEVMDDAETDNYSRTSMENYNHPLETVIKEEPPDAGASTSGKVHIPIKLEDLDGIDMMALPIQLADEAGEVIQVDASADVIQEERVVEVDESLTETTHANFLSLVRALFPARDAHRASKQQLHARCGAVMKSPIAPLNTWYSLSDDWCAELDSALEFLAGERGTHPDDFVPYLQYMPKTQMYQWIGAGRDCDSILDRLCDRWLRAMSPRLGAKNPPPPKYPTSWTVRPPTSSDISEFRVQERRRFTSASKPFTYIQHGYRSVVGPCARAWVSSGCAGTALLVADRPRHATFTSLVRDALARLPNGEGTKHDVMTLLKMSQYIAQCSEQALLGSVNAVLDRFHTAKRDPVVKFDQRTGVWTYLHRNRTEDDWMKTTSGRSRGAKATAAISPTLLPPSSPPPAPLPRPPIAAKPVSRAIGKPSVTSPPPLVKTGTPIRETAQNVEVETTGMEETFEASDSDVDVDDSSVTSSAPQLSSAQLLMQATLGQSKFSPPKLSKKPTYIPPAKRAYTPKLTTLTKQNKQAALMSQSVKQAKILAEAVKQASATAQNKANLAAARNIAKQAALLSKASTSQALQAALQGKTALKTPKTVKLPCQSPKAAQSPKQPPVAMKQMPTSPLQHPFSPMQPPSPKQMPPSPKPPPSPKQSSSPRPQSPSQPPSPKIPGRQLLSANKPAASAKQPLIAPDSPKLSSKQPISEKQFPSVYLSKEEFSLSGTDFPQSPKQSPPIEIKSSQTVFLRPQSPLTQVQLSKQSPTPMPPLSAMTSLQSPMPAQSIISPQVLMPPPPSPPPKSPMPLKPAASPQSMMPPPQSPMASPQSTIQHSPLQTPKLSQTKHLTQVGKQFTKAGKQLPLIIKHTDSSKPAILTKPVVTQTSIKTISPQQVAKPLNQANVTLSRSASLPTIVATQHKSPLIKQRTSIKSDAVQASVVKANAFGQQISTAQTIIHPIANPSQSQKMAPGTRSLLIRPPSLQTSVTASVASPTQATGARRGVVRVLSPANQSSGKSLISPRALLQDTPTAKKRTTISNTGGTTTLAQSPISGTAVVSTVQTAIPTSVPMRTVQLAGGRTLQLSANQTVHFPGGQAVQLSPGHALQLSSLQLPSLQMQHTTHSVRLPSGQTVPLATPQVMQALKASKNQTPRVQTTSTLKTLQTNQTVIPVSSVQLAGQTVQFGNQTVQLAGQSVQLTGHTVKLPSGQSVQVASPNVLPSSVQLSGQTFQLSGGSMQTVQMGGQSVQIPSSALGSQTVQLAGQTVQLANSQTVQLANNQTVQLAGSQTVQLPSGQTLQLPSGQTLQLAGGVQLANQAKTLPQVRSQGQADKMGNQPIMAKLLTNAQGQMVSLEGVVGGGRIVSGIRPRPQVRVLSPATRLTRPLLLTSAKPLHNIILQSDGSAVRVTSAGNASTSQTIVISNMAAQTVTTPTTTTPVLKLQQVNPIQQVKLAQGIKIQQPSSSTPTSSGVRSVLMDGQQLKLVSGRHVLARILRPNPPQ